MKTAIFFAGTNGVGKTTLMRNIISRLGGIERFEDNITYLNNSRYAVLGKYDSDSKTNVGVDWIKNTRSLANLIKLAHGKGVDVVFAEGSMLHSFGINITNAVFAAPRRLWVVLFADTATLAERIKKRSGVALSHKSIDKQRFLAKNFEKMKRIGVDAVAVNTAKHSTDEIAEWILNYCNNVDGLQRKDGEGNLL
jgi:broad-specificity NMP kinase